MPSFRTGTVTAIIDERPALQRVEVDGERAYVLTDLIGPVAVGDRVVMNTTAVDLGLGTGGWHIVHWNLGRESWSVRGRGHQMKLRYTSLQADTGADEQAVPGGEVAPTGVPVIVCGLHSQVGVVAVVARDALPEGRIAYVMTDAAALPLAMSELVLALRRGGILDFTITAGQAFGGDIEAVNTPSAIDLAARAGADVIIVGMGPGSLGTGSTFGFSGLEVGSIVDASAALGHQPIVAVRFSSADPRERHLGVSHHTQTALRRFAHTRAVVPIPRGQPWPDLGDHTIVEVDPPDVAELLRRRDIEITSMGRGPEPDPEFFSFAAAAGVHAAALAMVRHDPSSVPGPPVGDGDGGDGGRSPGEVVAAWAQGSVVTARVAEPGAAGETDAGASAEVEEPAPPAEPEDTVVEEPTLPAEPEDAAVEMPPVDEQQGDAPDVAPGVGAEPPLITPPLPPIGAEPPEGETAGTGETADTVHDRERAPDGQDADASGAEGKSGKRRRRSTTRNLVEWGLILGGALVAAFLIKTFLIQAFFIPSASMDPTLDVGDRVLVNKLSYRLHDVNRGDIVVFDRPPGAGDEASIKDLIKRVIGLPGDTIETRDGDVYINGRRLDEPYLDDSVITTGIPKQRVPRDHYWVMGDNRSASRDSRVFSAIPEDTIVGRAFVRVWPVFDLTLL